MTIESTDLQNSINPAITYSECYAQVFLGDCLELYKNIEPKSIDLILTDLPYGTTACKWDSVIPFDKLWKQYERIIKDNGAIILFGQGMFTAELMLSNKKLWRYNLIWKKGNRISGFLNSKKQPLRNHEDIMVFYKNQPTYNPQMTYGEKSHKKGGGNHKNTQRCYGKLIDTPTIETNEKYPISILTFDREHPPIHQTQKSLSLLEYLIKTYTNEGETVLDNTCGSVSTGVAAVNTNRNFIGIEMDDKYFGIARKRIEDAQKDLKLSL